MASLTQEVAPVQDAEPCEPAPEDWQWYCETARAEEAAADAIDLTWLEAQIGYHRHLHAEGQDSGGWALLVAGELEQLLRAFRRTKARSVRELQRWSTAYSRLDLDRFGVPAYSDHMDGLARSIADAASELCDYHRGLKTLAGATLLRLADDVERFGSTSAEDYIVDEAAYRAAAIDAMCELIEF